MLDSSQTRPGLNKGKYLFFNPLLRVAVGTVDLLAGLRGADSTSEYNIEPERILVALQSHIGDVIIGTSVLRVLRLSFPSAKIGFLTHPASRIVVEGHPLVDQVHTFEHWKLNRRPIGLVKKFRDHLRNRFNLVRELRASRYDLAIDLYAYFPNSTLLLASAGIPARLGWSSGGFGAWLTHRLDWDESGAHMVEWHKRLLSRVVRCRPILESAAPELYLSDSTKSEWNRTRDGAGITGPYLAFHVGAGSVRRRWLDAEWHALLEACSGLQMRVVLLGQGEVDERLCTLLSHHNHNAVNLAGALSWHVMSAALAGARLVVGLDSMSSHAAAAWGVPTVCISSGITGPEWRPYGLNTRVVVSPTPCAPCYLPAGCEEMECIRRTKAITVFSAVEEKLHHEP